MNTKEILQKLIPTLYEDDHVLAVFKPAGIDAGDHPEQRAVGLAEIVAKLRGVGEPFRVANRLSRYESGVLLLCKRGDLHRHIRNGLRQRKIRQEYVAVVLGSMARSRIHVEAKLGPRASARPLRQKGKRSAAPLPRQGAITSPPTTSVQRLEKGTRRTLVLCETTVDTTHALRAQLRAAGLRLLGDALHDSTARRQQQPERTCLCLTHISFHHPMLKTKVTVTCKAPPAFGVITAGESDVRPLLQAALVRRAEIIASNETDAYRLLTGDMEGVKGLVAERYGDIAILRVFRDRAGLADLLHKAASWYRKALGLSAVYVTSFLKDESNMDRDLARMLRPGSCLVGKAPAGPIVVRDRDLRYVVGPDEGASAGLFLDQRENRYRIRALAEGRHVLNLFAYTCSFSVAAAAGQAASVTSVDIGGPALDWGKENLSVNHLDAGIHTFVRDDALSYLRRAKRQEKTFDMIVLDPPTFAHGRKRGQAFSITTDLAALIEATVDRLNPGGILLVSTNYRKMTGRVLKQRIRQGASGRAFQVIDTPRLPADFAVDRDHAKSMLVRFA